LRNQVKATKKLTNKPFGSNIFVMNPLAQEFAEVLAEEAVKVATVSGGSPKALIPILHDLGIRVIVVCPTVEGAKGAEALGADAIVAEGAESGGVQGFKGVSTMVLVPAVVDAVKIPVIAAGGIGDSRGYKAALALGAEGVQMGTRFIATKECIAHSVYKSTIVDSDETGTGLVNMGRFQLRALRTPLVERLTKGEEFTRPGFNRQIMEDAWIKGDLETGPLPAGQVTGLISDIPSVREVIHEMVK
jgi:enoyl-[acyl-carrier protein] reductase II